MRALVILLALFAEQAWPQCRPLETRPPNAADQKPAFEALLQQSMRDRDEIQTELYDIYKTLDELRR